MNCWISLLADAQVAVFLTRKNTALLEASIDPKEVSGQLAETRVVGQSAKFMNPGRRRGASCLCA